MGYRNGFDLNFEMFVYRVGIDMPTIEVKFENVTVEADVNTGSRALPSFINFHIDILEVQKPKSIHLIDVFRTRPLIGPLVDYILIYPDEVINNLEINIF